MGPVEFKVSTLCHRELTDSKQVTVATYDPFSHSEQVYLGNMDIELSFIKQNLRTDQQFDGDELAREFIHVNPPSVILTKNRFTNTKYLPQDKNSQWTFVPSK
jgi:hypothetical protein